jgi:glycosyltransferase involved in cell wall biosynthesis
MRRLSVAWRVLQSEGLLAVRDRTLDRMAELRRRRSYTPAQPDWRSPEPIPVLNLSATPPAPRLGGVQAQLLRRIEAESKISPTALLHPKSGGWRLEVQAGDERRSLSFPGSPPSQIALDDESFERVIRSAAEAVQASSVYVDGLAGLPLGSLLRLQREGLELTMSLHDFAVFCPRPHLLEKPQLRFCWYSRDFHRCGRCLRQDWPVEDRFQQERREIGAELLAGASSIVFPSEFLRRTYRDLFAGLAPERLRIVEPARTEVVSALGRRGPGPIRHIALVGGVQPHKGALIFEEVVRKMAGAGLRWTSYGGGDPELLVRLRQLPRVRVRGYYRSGTLPHLLRRERVDLALLLSIVPESYSLVLDECVSAGVPVIAFDLGAVGERLPHLGAGELMSLESGAEGIVRALSDSFNHAQHSYTSRP